MPTTRHRSTRKAAAAAAASVALLAAACSSGDSSSSSTTKAPSAPTTKIPAAQKNAAAAALVPAEVASTGQLTFAMDASYPPDEFLAPGSSTIIGMDADLATAISQTLGLTSVQKNVTFDAIIPGLQANKYNVGLSSFTDTAAREQVVDFVNYFNAGEAFYVKSGAKKSFTSTASLCGHTVSVESGTVEEEESKKASTTCTKAGKGAVKVLSFSDQNGANLAVSSGRAEVGYADSPVVGYIVAQSGGTFEQSGDVFNQAPYGIALPKGTTMTQAVQAAMKSLIADGTYGAIMKKWGTEAGAVTSDGVTINGAAS
jgi:polar amino acid transport system substrate-binding protein